MCEECSRVCVSFVIVKLNNEPKFALSQWKEVNKVKNKKLKKAMMTTADYNEWLWDIKSKSISQIR